MNSASNLYLIISLRLDIAGLATSSIFIDLLADLVSSLYREELFWSSSKFSLPDLCDNIGSVGMSKFWSVWSLCNETSDLLYCVFLSVMFLSISSISASLYCNNNLLNNLFSLVLSLAFLEVVVSILRACGAGLSVRKSLSLRKLMKS